MAAELAACRAHYDAEEMEDAMEASRRAAALLRSSGDEAGAAAALRLHALALIGADRRGDAADFARKELTAGRADGHRRVEAAMLLSLSSASVGMTGAKQLEEARQCANEALALGTQLGDRKLEAEALQVLSACATRGADAVKGAQEALVLASRARELAAQLSDRRLEAESLHCVALGHAAAGDMDACLEAADQALDLYIETKDKRREAFELLAMAEWSLQTGDADRAISDAEEVLEIYKDLVSPKELSAWRMVFAAHLQKGDKRRALRTAKESSKRFKALGSKSSEARSLDMLVSAFIAVDQLEEALETAERALSLFQGLGDRGMEAKMSNAISGLHLRMGRFDRALQLGEDAAMLYREEGGSTEEKVEAMFHVVESHLQKKDPSSALQCASEMRAHFQKEGDVRGEASALMTMGQVCLTMDRLDEASTSLTRAQVMLGEASSQYGEASALRMLAEIFSRKEEHKSAVRSAERSRTMFRELGDKADEAHSLYFVAQESIALAVAEGARVGAGAGNKAATDAVSKGSKAAETVIKMARDMDAAQGLLASGLCIMAQVHMLNAKPDEALAAADEAIVLFRDTGAAVSEANALLLSADALRVMRQYKDSGDAAEEARRLFSGLEGADQKGKEAAQEILDYLDQVKQQQQQQAQMQQAMLRQGAAAMPGMTLTAPAGGAAPDGPPPAAVSMARTDRERGPALDMTGADIETIKAKVAEIAHRITGADDGEIELDTPLMEAGLTSNSAIILRDELSQEMPGVSLPVTLVFDYPSIGAMADLIAESSGKALRN